VNRINKPDTVVPLTVAHALLVLIVLTSCVAYGGWRLGRKNGEARATDAIIAVFLQAVGRDHMPDSDQFKEASATDIGEMLLSAAEYAAVVAPRTTPHETALVMNTADIELVARLADDGFRSYMPRRLTEDQAWRTAAVLDTFERKIAKNLLTEPPEERDRRFSQYENRI
jgi:hypothetical protein